MNEDHVTVSHTQRLFLKVTNFNPNPIIYEFSSAFNFLTVRITAQNSTKMFRPTS